MTNLDIYIQHINNDAHLMLEAVKSANLVPPKYITNYHLTYNYNNIHNAQYIAGTFIEMLDSLDSPQ